MIKLNKYKNVFIVIFILLIAILTYSIVKNTLSSKITIKSVNEDNYAFNYDSTWKIKEEKSDSVVLKHSSDSVLTIQIKKLNDDYKYLDIDDIIDEVIHSIKKQNNNYNLISNKKDYLTKNNYEGYKLLYENDKEQIMINLYKKSDKLVIIKYESSNKYFDILLDSVHSIIYNLDIKENKIDLKTELDIELADLKYNEDVNIDKLFKDSNSYEIASNHYLVKYSIPNIFKLNSINSTAGRYTYDNDDSKITINTSISEENIYEYLDKNETFNVYSNYNYYHDKDSTDYSDYKESLSRLNSDYDSYIYKNSFKYLKATKYDKDYNPINYERNDECAELIYALDNNHILIVKIEADGIPITEKLIKSFKIESVTNYASYIQIEKEGNYLIGRLKRFSNYENTKIEEIKIKIPSKYSEVDDSGTLLNQNIYEERNYALNYHDDLDMYDYNVQYKRLTGGYESHAKYTTISTSYGKYQEMKQSKNININDKTFVVYDGGYTEKAGIFLSTNNRKLQYVNIKQLYYKLYDDKDDYLCIEVRGHGKEITNDILKDVTLFSVEEIDV